MTRVFARTFLPNQSRQSITEADTKRPFQSDRRLFPQPAKHFARFSRQVDGTNPAFSPEIGLREALADYDRGGVLDVDPKPRERSASDVDVNRLCPAGGCAAIVRDNDFEACRRAVSPVMSEQHPARFDIRLGEIINRKTGVAR